MGALTELVSKARRGGGDSKLELEEHLRPLVHGVLIAWVPHFVAGPMVRRLINDGFGAIMSEDARFVPTLLARVRAAGQSAQVLSPNASDPATDDPGRRDALAILARLRKLPERERERLALRLLEGIAGPELCEAFAASDKDVAADLERGLAALQEGVALKDDPYLWNLSGAPHPAVVRLENLLTPLRFDDAAAAAQEREVETNPTGVPPVELTPVSGPTPQAIPAVSRRPTNEHKPPAIAPVARPPGAMAPTSVNEDPRRAPANLGQPEAPSPSGKFLFSMRDDDDEDFGERTEALVPVPGRAPNPFEVQPSTVAAQDLPAAAQVNPYAAMPGTVAANDLPAAARLAEPGPSGPVPQPTGKRPTGAAPGLASPGVRPTAEAPLSVVGPALKSDAFDDSTSVQAPVPLKKQLELGAPAEAPTGMQVALGAPVENSTRVMAVPAPVHWKSVLFAEDDEEASITLPVPERDKLLRKKGVWRGRAPFVVSAMMATLAVAIAWMTIASTTRRSQRAWNLVPVSVAAIDLAEGTVVTEDKISTRSVPEQFVTASVVKPDGYSYVVGQKLLVPVQAGDPLLWSHFELAQVTERLARRVQKRARAVSINTSRAAAVGGWVRPGDWVDLIFSVKDSKDQAGARAAVTLVQDVPVVATGKISEKSNYGILSASQREYHHVSVLLLPEEVEMVTLAKEVGNVKFTLRTEGDHETSRDGYGSSAKTLLDGARVKLLQLRRMATIQIIRDTPSVPVMPRPDRLRIEPKQ
jgi:pilus assembly protein CpaB